MKQWARAIVAEKCGLCGRAIPVGAPVLKVVIVQVRAMKFRCADCADEPVPHLVEATPNAPPLHTLRRLGFLPLDEREPGEDG